MHNTEANRSPVIWPQVAVLLIAFALLLALLLARTLPPRPQVILPRNVAQLREVARIETHPNYLISDVHLDSTSNTLIATSGYFNYVWRLADGTYQVMDLRESGGYIPQLMLPSDQPTAVFLNWVGTMSLLDMTSGQTIQRFDGVQASSLQNWAFSRTGDRLAISSPETFSVLDVATQERQFTAPAPEGRSFHYSYPAFSPDSSLLATVYRDVSCQCPADISVWDAATGEQTLLGPFPGDSATAFAFSEDNQLLAVGGHIWKDVGSDSMIQLWNLETGAEIIIRRMEGHSVDDIVISPDKHLLAMRDSSSIWLWAIEDLIAGGPPLVAEHGDGNAQNFDGIAFSPDYRLFAYGTPDGIIRVVDSVDGTLLAELRGHVQNILDLRFSADGRLLVSSGYDRTIRLWGLADPGFDPPELASAAPPAPVMTPTLPG